MQASDYEDVNQFLLFGILPQQFTSTKANFIVRANKFVIDSVGNLTRQNKRVIVDAEKELIFEALHRNILYIFFFHKNQQPNTTQIYFSGKAFVLTIEYTADEIKRGKE